MAKSVLFYYLVYEDTALIAFIEPDENYWLSFLLWDHNNNPYTAQFQ